MSPTRPPAWGPSASSEQAVARDLSRWIASPEFAELASDLDGRIAPTDEALRFPFYKKLADSYDLRGGRERNQVARPVEEDAIAPSVEKAASTLGMLEDHQPDRSGYDYMLVLGGLAAASMLRVNFALDLLINGLQVGSTTVLTAHRPLMPGEKYILDQNIFKDASTEMDILATACESRLGISARQRRTESATDELTFRSAARLSWAEQSVGPLSVLCAPSSRPARRADSADTYQYWASLIDPRPGDSVLLVTSSIYVAYQHLVAVQWLGLERRCHIFTIGKTFTEASYGRLRRRYHVGNYLQEILSTLGAGYNLKTQLLFKAK